MRESDQTRVIAGAATIVALAAAVAPGMLGGYENPILGVWLLVVATGALVFVFHPRWAQVRLSPFRKRIAAPTTIEMIPPAQIPAARTPEEQTRYRALRLDIAFWAQQAGNMLAFDEWPLEVKVADELGWLNSAIGFEQNITRRLVFVHGVVLPDDLRRRLFPAPPSLWKPGAAPKRDGHTALFCSSYCRLAQQRTVLLELLKMIEGEM